jgi:glycosyltransferase involved in cell wall biosynthesis
VTGVADDRRGIRRRRLPRLSRWPAHAVGHDGDVVTRPESLHQLIGERLRDRDIAARVPSVRGLIIGGHEAEPDLGRVRDRVRALGLDARVELTGLVPPADVPALLARATILVLPNVASAISARFTSPLKLFEYMAAGRAIIASDLPAIREVITDDVNGLLVAPGDAAALAAAVTRLASTPALADRLARTAFEHARTFTWERRAERLEPVLERARNA